MSILEKQIRDLVAAGFKGQLLPGTLRRKIMAAGRDEHGDPIAFEPSTYPFEGMIDQYSAFTKATGGIPASDVKVLIIAGSLSVRPQKDDELKIRDQWYRVRGVSTDPAEATWECQSFAIADPSLGD
jgi:hypothetical protein